MWSTDRYRKNTGDAPPRDKPLVMATKIGSRRVIVAADKAAQALGLRLGLTVAHAQALVPELHVAESTPEADDEGLTRLATWCMRYSPLVAADRPNGVWLDVAASAHLFGGEEALLDDLQRRLRRAGVNARAAVADTPGAAWAVARHASERIVVPGGMAAAIAELPVGALRLPVETVDALRRFGVERIGQLAAMPNAPLAERPSAITHSAPTHARPHTACVSPSFDHIDHVGITFETQGGVMPLVASLLSDRALSRISASCRTRRLRTRWRGSTSSFSDPSQQTCTDGGLRHYGGPPPPRVTTNPLHMLVYCSACDRLP